MNTRKILLSVAGIACLVGVVGCDDIKSPTFKSELKNLQICGPVAGSGQCSTNSCPAISSEGVPVGLSRQYCALGEFTRLTDEATAQIVPRDVTGEVVWSVSRNPGVIVGNGSTGGLAQVQTSATPGTSATLTAVLGDMSRQQDLQISDATVETLLINPPIGNSLDALVGDPVFQFGCVATLSDGRQITVTNDATWVSAPSDRYQVSNVAPKGRGTALQATPENDPVAVQCLRDGKTSNTVLVSVCDGTLEADDTPGSIDDNGLTITPVGPLVLIPGTDGAAGVPQQLTLTGRFQTGNPGACGSDENGVLFRNLTSIASWSSDAETIATVGNGDANGVAGLTRSPANGVFGTTLIRAAFGDAQESVAVSVADERIVDLLIKGPATLLEGAIGQYTVTPVTLDDNGERVEADPIGADAALLWQSSKPTVLSFPSPNDGTAQAAANVAGTQPVVVTASYLGKQKSKITYVLDVADLVDVQVTPSLACISSTGAASRITQQLDANGIFKVDNPANPGSDVFCTAKVNNAATWTAAGLDGTTASGGDLLTLLTNLDNLGDALGEFLGGLFGQNPIPPGSVPASPFDPAEFLGGNCDPLLPVGVNSGPALLDGSPVAFVNDPPDGLIRPTTNTALPIPLTIGTACVQAAIEADGGTVSGQATALVAIDIIPEVCDAISVLTEPLLQDGDPVPLCEDVLNNASAKAQGE